MEDHLAQARINYSLFREFYQADRALDWALTFLFYAALHLIQAQALQHDPAPPLTHRDRDEYVARYLAGIAVEYELLYQGSRSARYALWDPTQSELQLYHDIYFAPLAAELAVLGFAL